MKKLKEYKVNFEDSWEYTNPDALKREVEFVLGEAKVLVFYFAEIPIEEVTGMQDTLRGPGIGFKDGTFTYWYNLVGYKK